MKLEAGIPSKSVMICKFSIGAVALYGVLLLRSDTGVSRSSSRSGGVNEVVFDLGPDTDEEDNNETHQEQPQAPAPVAEQMQQAEAASVTANTARAEKMTVDTSTPNAGSNNLAVATDTGSEYISPCKPSDELDEDADMLMMLSPSKRNAAIAGNKNVKKRPSDRKSFSARKYRQQQKEQAAEAAASQTQSTLSSTAEAEVETNEEETNIDTETSIGSGSAATTVSTTDAAVVEKSADAEVAAGAVGVDKSKHGLLSLFNQVEDAAGANNKDDVSRPAVYSHSILISDFGCLLGIAP
jgi:hypothetical protein